jgi:hypothetical protein
MGAVKVYAPNPQHNGVSAGQQFRGGVAEVDESNAASLAYFARAGYSIGEPIERTEPEPAASGDGENTNADEAPEGMPPKTGPGSAHDKWEAYARSLGVDPEGKHRAEIIAAVEAHLAGENADDADNGDADDADEEGDGEE